MDVAINLHPKEAIEQVVKSTGMDCADMVTGDTERETSIHPQLRGRLDEPLVEITSARRESDGKII